MAKKKRNSQIDAYRATILKLLTLPPKTLAQRFYGRGPKLIRDDLRGATSPLGGKAK